MYNSTIRGLSLAMILVQVATGQTEQLVERIGRWPSVEIRSFVSELMLSLYPWLTLYVYKLLSMPLPLMS
jgi:hypothetical protein